MFRFVVACSVGGLLAFACATTFAADPIEDVSKTVGDWVKTRDEIVRLETTWNQERALLGSTLNGLKERADQLQDKRDHILAATAEEREEIAALNAKREKAEASVHAAETRLGELSSQLIALRPMLPPRLSEALEMAYRSLASSTPGPGERMQLVMTVLNRCAQFNATVDQGEEVVQFDGEPTPRSVDVIYWGLSHGYALDRVAGRAWLGTPGAGQWRWEPLDGAADAVAELMAVRRDESNPVLVAVPARLSASGGKKQ